MTDNEIIKAFDILDKFEFFGGQRAGRELWFNKPTDIQNKDIGAFLRDLDFLKQFINRQKAEIERLENSLAISKKKTKRYVENYKRQKEEMEEYRNIIERATEGIREVKAMLPIELAKERAKAVKEFAEMLKATAIGRVAWDDDDEAIEGFVAVDEIDNLVKEFSEGGDTK
jgi:phosphoenolpyruvate synthase/pyruvate phosphate dikinase